ncbi:GPI transamidase component PIG-T-like [Acropora muricata]|uniref:GPI transamidase component PIG-T-like n=1 Tax=Acropora muricata TaxID=159855 RepID=UPI0034E5E8C7
MAAVAVTIVFSSLFLSVSLATEDAFHEELIMRPLSTGHVYAHFQFSTVWHVDVEDPKAFSHYKLFPKSLGQIINQYSVEELHLTLTQGQWPHELWGYPVVSAPPGTELWVFFKDNIQKSVDDNWSGLTQALSGQFCASLNFIDSKTTTSPKLSFRREGVAFNADHLNSSLLRHAALAREIVCTENLTPWKKLLPCDSKAGLTTLFNSLLLYSVNYHSLGVHLRPICRDPSCSAFSLELVQSLALVFDPVLRGGSKLDWSFKKLFGRAIKSACPLARTSKVYVDISRNKSGSLFTLAPEFSVVTRQMTSEYQQHFAVYDVKQWTLENPKDRSLNVAFKWKKRDNPGTPPQFYAQRFLTGYGEEKGGITSLLHNRHPTDPLSVVYFTTFPWFLRIFLHTLTIHSGGKDIKPDIMHFTPAKDRSRPYSLELLITLPANSVTELSIQFNKVFLKWTEHPPDAHHGFYISSAVISTKLRNPLNYTGPSRQSSVLFSSLQSAASEEVFIRLHTSILLITLPTPDFSMPYNVICLTCTVVAIAFGSFHNLSSRRFEAVDQKDSKGPVGKFIEMLRKLKAKLFRKKEEASEEKKEN